MFFWHKKTTMRRSHVVRAAFYYSLGLRLKTSFEQNSKHFSISGRLLEGNEWQALT